MGNAVLSHPTGENGSPQSPPAGECTLVALTADLRLLRYFIAVAEELHFGRAAKRLGIADQPEAVDALRRELALRIVSEGAKSMTINEGCTSTSRASRPPCATCPRA